MLNWFEAQAMSCHHSASPLWASAQEFEPWFKWMIMDAILALLLNITVHRVRGLRPVFLAIGWL